MNTIELSREQIREEVQAIREAAGKIPRTREAAASFLKRIGATGWPSKGAGSLAARRRNHK